MTTCVIIAEPSSGCTPVAKQFLNPCGLFVNGVQVPWHVIECQEGPAGNHGSAEAACGWHLGGATGALSESTVLVPCPVAGLHVPDGGCYHCFICCGVLCIRCLVVPMRNSRIAD